MGKVLKFIVASVVVAVICVGAYGAYQNREDHWSLGEAKTYHHGLGWGKYVEYTCCTAGGAEIFVISLPGRYKVYTLQEVGGKLLVLRSGLLGNMEVVSRTDDYEKVVPTEERQWIAYARADDQMTLLRNRPGGWPKVKVA